MLKHPELTLRRIERFLRFELTPRLWADQRPLDAAIHQPISPVPPANAPNLAYTPIAPGHAWGPIWTDAWFRFSGTIPAEWQGKRVAARLHCGAEAILWQGDEPIQGVDWNHTEVLLSESAAGGEAVTLYVRANGMNPKVSSDQYPETPSETPFTFQFAHLALHDAELFALYYDVKVAIGVMKEQRADEPRYGQLLMALNEVVNLYDAEEPSSVGLCRETLAEVYQKPATASAHDISAIGHAHIDTAWLWPLERTQQKCLHTFATATKLMDAYPEYRFLCSQTQQYAWVKELAPKLYERIKEKVRSGQWEVAGSMWVEADCNIPSGESLVRQILIGKNWWMDEFGVETVDLWLPDVFGYAAALPQILKKSGIEYFLTQKISWNQINKFPHHTFEWEGIDGTRIFTHFLPVDTYNAMLTPSELAYNVHNFRDNDRATRSLYAYGYGDGGGGPTAEMLENARRLRDVEGMPRVTLEKARDFFAKAQAEAKDLPLWVGELYLEYHRGTYTTQAANKRGNRKAEFLLRDAEFLAVAAAAFGGRGLSGYPAQPLLDAWKLTLLNQFHDIIPGSSVNEVYRDSDRDYAEIMRLGEKVVSESLTQIAGHIRTEGYTNPVLVVRNYDDWVSGGLVSVPLAEGQNPESVRYGAEAPAAVQIVEEGGKRVALFAEQTLEEGHGYTVYDLSNAPAEQVNEFVVTPALLDNGTLRVEFDTDGLITRIYDQVAEREVMVPGERGNQLQLFKDRPLAYDAWDVDIFYQETGPRVLTELDSAEVVEEGPVRGAIRFTRRFGQSKIVQTIRLNTGSKRLDFSTEVDWHESHLFLKAAFPVAIRSPKASYEIQYGHVERPTHYNTSWDLARFEVAAQKWADLSENGYGVALLNDCKYGHDTFGSTLRLSLLRSPKAPDPQADMGHHTFTYSLLPHTGTLQEGHVIEEAMQLNVPPRVLPLPAGQPGILPSEQLFFAVDQEGVLLEAVKKAEREDAIIVRLYEAFGGRGTVTLKTTLPIASASACDLMERAGASVSVVEVDGMKAISFQIAPFEIVTFKLQLQ